MASSVRDEELSKIKNTFSIKNFIADMPRMLNKVFSTIYNCIKDFYDPNTNKVKCDSVETSYLSATTIVAQNLSFRGSNNEICDFASLISRIESLESKIQHADWTTKRYFIDSSFPLDSSVLIKTIPH